MPKSQTLSLIRFQTGGPIHFLTLEDEKLYKKYKRPVKELMKDRPAGEYCINIQSHWLGLYYTYFATANVYVPENHR